MNLPSPPKQYDPREQAELRRSLMQEITRINNRTFPSVYETPESYGAIGDGVADDTAAIQAAVDTGRAVFLDAKTYRITDSIKMAAGTTVIGASFNLSTGETATVIKADGDIWGFEAADKEISNTGIVLANIKVLGKTSPASGPGAVDLEGCNNAILENIVFAAQNGTTKSTGPAFRIASNLASGEGGLYSQLYNCVALHANIGFEFLNTTNANMLHGCRIGSCNTGVVLAGSHNWLFALDVEVVTDGITMDSSTTENVFFAPNFDGVTGTAYIDSGVSNYMIAPHFASCATEMSGLDGAMVWDTVHGSIVPGILDFTEFSGDGFAQLRGPVNRQMRYYSRGNSASTCGHAFFSKDSGGNDVQRLQITDDEDTARALFTDTSVHVNTAGCSVGIKEGSNAKMGAAVLVAGTVTVNTTAVASGSRIFLTVNTAGGTVGSPYVSARTAGTSFTITSTNAADTSTVAWWIIDSL